MSDLVIYLRNLDHFQLTKVKNQIELVVILHKLHSQLALSQPFYVPYRYFVRRKVLSAEI